MKNNIEYYVRFAYELREVMNRLDSQTTTPDEELKKKYVGLKESLPKSLQALFWHPYVLIKNHESAVIAGN